MGMEREPSIHVMDSHIKSVSSQNKNTVTSDSHASNIKLSWEQSYTFFYINYIKIGFIGLIPDFFLILLREYFHLINYLLRVSNDVITIDNFAHSSANLP